MRLSRLRISAIVISVLALAGCGSDGSAGEGTQASGNAQLREFLPQEIRDAGELTVATPYGNPPTIFVDASGKPTGIAYEIGEEIGKTLGIKMSWSELQFAGVIPGLQGGRFDLSMGVIGDTPERQKVLDFVDLMQNDSALLVPKNSSSKLSSLENACGRRVGVLAGSLQVKRVQGASGACTAAGKQPISMNEYSTTNDAQAQVASGRVDAYLAPYVIMSHTARTAGNGQTFEVMPVRYPDNPWAIGMQKNRGDLPKAIHGALQEVIKSGRYKEILDKYGASDAALTDDQVLINGAGTPPFQAKD